MKCFNGVLKYFLGNIMILPPYPPPLAGLLDWPGVAPPYLGAEELKKNFGAHKRGGAAVRRPEKGSVSAPGIFLDPRPTGDLLGVALSAVRAQCNDLDV